MYLIIQTDNSARFFISSMIFAFLAINSTLISSSFTEHSQFLYFLLDLQGHFLSLLGISLKLPSGSTVNLGSCNIFSSFCASVSSMSFTSSLSLIDWFFIACLCSLVHYFPFFISSNLSSSYFGFLAVPTFWFFWLSVTESDFVGSSFSWLLVICSFSNFSYISSMTSRDVSIFEYARNPPLPR